MKNGPTTVSTYSYILSISTIIHSTITVLRSLAAVEKINNIYNATDDAIGRPKRVYL